jgi:hypothetical protein
MTRGGFFALVPLAPVAALALIAAQRPEALAPAAPGLWEIDGLPGASAPARECVADVVALAQYEHRAKRCTRNLVSNGPSFAVITYTCAGNEFGRSKLTLITPRSLRIETQGISDNLPFAYVLQARRIGDCPGRETAARH